MENLKPPNELDLSPNGRTTVAEKWRQWKQTMQLFIDLTMSKNTEKEKCSAFLYTIGQAGRDVYNTMTLGEEEADKIDILFSKFEAYCKPKQNVTIERYRFNTRAQGEEETIDQYVTELRLIAKNCGYGDLEDQLVRDRIVCGTNSEEVRQRLLRIDDLSLQKAISVCRVDAESRKSSKYIAETSGEVFGLRSSNKPHRFRREVTKDTKKFTEGPRRPCGICGLVHNRKQCPAYGKRCHKCNKLNHFSKYCRSSNRTTDAIEQCEDPTDSDDAESLFIDAIKNDTELTLSDCYTTLQVEGSAVKFKVDTGSQVNILPLRLYRKLKTQPPLTKSSTKLSGYSGGNLKVVGCSRITCQQRPLLFYVVDTTQDPILGLAASQNLGIVKIVLNIAHDTKHPVAQFPKLFKGLGCLKTPYHIQTDSSITPVVNPPRNQPVAIRDRLKNTLDDMEKMGVVRRVDGPTDWVNSLVVVEKPKTKKLRVCLDPRHLNNAIRREHFQLPTLEDITTRLSGASIFSKLDANHGYWQIPLSEESQLLTTFNSPFGRYCFQRMPFGIKSAQEVFQKRMCQLIGDLPGVETDIDDILVWGTNQEEHDSRLAAVLKRCEEINLTLNQDKCLFGVPEVTYIGHILNAEGVKPDPAKVRAIKDMPAPSDKKGVERLLGTINYLAKFIPNMSTITQPVRSLLKSDIIFEWKESQEKAFQEIKEVLSKHPVLAYFDVTKPVTISCDASQSGLGAVILQDSKPIAYASRALTDTETRYAQIEKELLAVVFAFHRFHQYVYGKDVIVESDHKPLEAITRKQLSAAPPRLQRMLLQLQRYSFSLVYKPGKEMTLADTLSRAYLEDEPNSDNLSEDLICAVNMVLNNLPVSDAKLKAIQQATRADPVMTKLQNVIRLGWPNNRVEVPQCLRAYWNFREELSEANGIILKGERIVIPTSLRKEMLEKIHASHMGIVKCKRRAKDVLFWPGMGRDIEERIATCETCSQHQLSNTKEPMISDEPPTRPWELVSTDLFHLEGEDYLLIVDSYSHYIEIVKLKSTTSKTVIEGTKSIFARHGIPRIIKSDNGPQYTSGEYKEFSKNWGFHHVTVSPYYPQANGLAEKSVQIIKRLIKKAKSDGRDPYLSLLEYRNTPINNVGSPAQLSMGRRLNSLLPCTSEQLAPQVIDPKKVTEATRQVQERNKKYYDRSAKELPGLKPRDAVRVQMGNKWVPGTVKGLADTPRSYIVRVPGGQELRRNRRHLRKGSLQPAASVHTDDDDDIAMQPAERSVVEDPSETQAQEFSQTSRGRTIRTPARYQDFVKH